MELDQKQMGEAITSLHTAFDEFKKANDEALNLKADAKTVDPLLTDKLDKLETEIEKRSKQVEDAGKVVTDANLELKSRLDSMEVSFNRSGHGQSDDKEEKALRDGACDMIIAEGYESGRPIDMTPDTVDPSDVKAFAEYCKQYDSYIRKGKDRFVNNLNKSGNFESKILMSVDRDPGGGYWVTPDMSSRIATVVFESSPVRQFASVETIGSDSLELIADENQASFGWVAEQEARPQTDTPDIGKRVIFAHELYAEPRVTQKLLDDAGFNVEAWLSRKVADRFARAEATAFVTGTGVGQPRGFTTYPSGTATGQMERINSGVDGEITADGLLDLIYSLKGPYLTRARFMAARLTIRDIRKLKDGTGNYLWEPNNQVGQPATLMGYGMSQADDMAAVASASLSVAFGDFQSGYTIVDRKGIRVLRDPFTAKPFIKLYTTKRVGGDVVNFEAIKLQLLSV